MARHPDDRLHVADLPAEVGDARPRPRWSAPCRRPTSRSSACRPGRSTSCRSSSASGPTARGRLRCSAPARATENGYVARQSWSARPAGLRSRQRPRGCRRSSRCRPEHVVAGAQQRRQHERQRRRLVLDPQHSGGARRAATGPAPGPDDVEVGVPLEVADPADRRGQSRALLAHGAAQTWRTLGGTAPAGHAARSAVAGAGLAGSRDRPAPGPPLSWRRMCCSAATTEEREIASASA